MKNKRIDKNNETCVYPEICGGKGAILCGYNKLCVITKLNIL